MSDLNANITPVTSLSATIDTIIYPTNYNDLTHKPQINGVTLSGNKTASDLGLASAGDITVTSVNAQTGAVVLDGDDIEYSEGVSVNSKIDDVESMITSSGVTSVNGFTGVVTLTGTNIEYSGGVSVNSKINAVESSIPVVNYPVTSVNAQTGAVVLDGEDIEYSSGVSVNSKINAVESSIPVVNYPVTSVNGETGAVVLDGDDIEYSSGVSVNSKIGTNTTAIGDLSSLTTSVQSSLVGAVNSLDTDKQDKITTTVGTAKNFTSSTTYNYTGVSITCPAGHTYLVQTRFNYSNSEPLEVGVGTATNNTNNYAMIAHTTQTNTVQFLIAGGYTFYYYAKYSGANSNSLTETIIDITD